MDGETQQPMRSDGNGKSLIFIIAILIILAGVGYAIWSNKTKQAAPVETTPLTSEVNSNAIVFNITGKMFEYSIKEIRVKKGDLVTINFESTDGLHDIVNDEIGFRTEAVNPGKKTSLTFLADKTGTFEYYCSIGQHRQNGMVGKLIIE